MTAHYARITDQTVRRRWEQATKVNIKGGRVTLDPEGPLAQAEWPKPATASPPRPCPTATARCRCNSVLPARQRVPDLPSLPHRTRVPARAARPASPHTHPDRCLQIQRAATHVRDEPAGPHQPGAHDRRNREQRAGGRRRCHGLITPTSSSPQPAAARPPPASARSLRCVAWKTPVHQSRSTQWRGKRRFPAHGSTTRATFAPRYDDFENNITLQPPRQSPTGNARPTTRYYDVSRLRPPNQAPGSGEQTAPRCARAGSRRTTRCQCSRQPRHADKQIRTAHRAMLTTASTTLSSSENRWPDA